MVEKEEQGARLPSPSDIYDQQEHAVGDVLPTASEVGSRTIAVPGLKNENMFKRSIAKGSPVRELIDSLHEKGKHVGASWKSGEVTLFVAKHRKAIVATSITTAVGVAAAVGTTIYLTRRSKGNKQ